MDNELTVLHEHSQHLERAAGLVVPEVQDSVVGVVIWCRDPEGQERVAITCRTRDLPILCFRAAWVNLKDTAVSYHDKSRALARPSQ